MATFIKAGFWEKLCIPCKGYKGWLNLDQFVESKVPAPAYKVYTALLTQTGGDDPNTVQGNVNIKPGVTYTIENLEPGDNLIPYGAPNNEIGTSFVCNQDVFNWGNPLSQLSFNGGAPTATVIENTIGNIWFTYGSVGLYLIYTDSEFTQNKTFAFFAFPGGAGNGGSASIYVNQAPQNLPIETRQFDGTPSESVLYETSFEIRVYN